MIILSICCVACSGKLKNQTLKLTPKQQALADIFYENKDKWERYYDDPYYDDLYCTGFQMFSGDASSPLLKDLTAESVIIICEYSVEPEIRSDSKSGITSLGAIVSGFAYIISENGFLAGKQIPPLLPANLLQKDPWGNSIYGFLGVGSYYITDEENQKKETIESLFLKYEENNN